jgi:hypothetical protein
VRTDLPQDFTFEHSELSETAFVEQDHITLGQRPSHVISMLHGIQTSGMWAAKLQFAARKKGLQVLPQPISYGWFGVLPFLFRLGTRRIERLVLSELKEIQERFPEASHSIVAHHWCPVR